MRILILDDHRLFLEGLRHVLEQLGDDIRIVAANTTERALALLDDGQRFNLILADLSLPGLDGFSFLAALRQRRIATPVVVISGTSDLADVNRALDNGALGFIPKSLGSRELLLALNQVLDGEIYVPAAYASAIFDNNTTNGRASSNAEGIGPRQLEVLKLMAEGKSNKQIATVLDITEATVKSHIGALFRALAVKNRTACVREAARRDLISLRGR